MDIAIMLEGQQGLNWERFKRIATAVEQLGFAGLYRSDHITNAQPPFLDALELWVSLTWLASHTERIEFGPLVSPVSFRNPGFTARRAKDVDALSGGRLTLGVGAGWQDYEHETYGFDLLPIPQRFARYEEGLQVITRLLRDEEPVTFEGDYFTLRGARLLPRPKWPSRPPILVGGNGVRRTLPLAARYADEWNGVFVPPEKYRELNAYLDQLLENENRVPGTVRRSLMTNVIFGRTVQEVENLLEGRSVDEVRARGIVVGTKQAVCDQLGQLADAGAQRVMLQWLALDDIDRLEDFAAAVL